MSGGATAAPDALTAWRLERVTAESMIGWVEALRDDNRIHVDPQAADALGYGPRTVNPGPANLAYVLNMLLAACPGSYPATIEAQFLGNVFAGDAVEITGERLRDGRCRAALHVADDGRVAVAVEATMERLDR